MEIRQLKKDKLDLEKNLALEKERTSEITGDLLKSKFRSWAKNNPRFYSGGKQYKLLRLEEVNSFNLKIQDLENSLSWSRNYQNNHESCERNLRNERKAKGKIASKLFEANKQLGLANSNICGLQLSNRNLHEELKISNEMNQALVSKVEILEGEKKDLVTKLDSLVKNNVKSGMSRSQKKKERRRQNIRKRNENRIAKENKIIRKNSAFIKNNQKVNNVCKDQPMDQPNCQMNGFVGWMVNGSHRVPYDGNSMYMKPSLTSQNQLNQSNQNTNMPNLNGWNILE